MMFLNLIYFDNDNKILLDLDYFLLLNLIKTMLDKSILSEGFTKCQRNKGSV
jgi:hypothetical protein